MSVYESLGWQWNGLQALTMSERLDRNQVEAHVQGHDVWLKPTAQALQQYLMVVPS